MNKPATELLHLLVCYQQMALGVMLCLQNLLLHWVALQLDKLTLKFEGYYNNFIAPLLIPF